MQRPSDCRFPSSLFSFSSPSPPPALTVFISLFGPPGQKCEGRGGKGTGEGPPLQQKVLARSRARLDKNGEERPQSAKAAAQRAAGRASLSLRFPASCPLKGGGVPGPRQKRLSFFFLKLEQIRRARLAKKKTKLALPSPASAPAPSPPPDWGGGGKGGRGKGTP